MALYKSVIMYQVYPVSSLLPCVILDQLIRIIKDFRESGSNRRQPKHYFPTGHVPIKMNKSTLHYPIPNGRETDHSSRILAGWLIVILIWHTVMSLV